MTFERGQRVRILHRPDLPGNVLVEMANQVGDGWLLFVEQATGTFAKSSSPPHRPRPARS